MAARDEILGNNLILRQTHIRLTPAGCAAGIKTLEIFERDNIIDHAADLAKIEEIIKIGNKNMKQ